MKDKKNALSVALVVLGMIALGLDTHPLPDGQERLTRLPTYGEGFALRPVAARAEDTAVFGTAAVRRFSLACEQGSFLLTVIDGTRNRHALHDPIYCVSGAGWQVADEEEIKTSHGRVKALRLQKQGQETHLLYFFADGTRHWTSPTRTWLAQALRRASLGNSSEAILLVELQPYQKTKPDWKQVVHTLPLLSNL